MARVSEFRVGVWAVALLVAGCLPPDEDPADGAGDGGTGGAGGAATGGAVGAPGGTPIGGAGSSGGTSSGGTSTGGTSSGGTSSGGTSTGGTSPGGTSSGGTSSGGAGGASSGGSSSGGAEAGPDLPPGPVTGCQEGGVITTLVAGGNAAADIAIAGGDVYYTDSELVCGRQGCLSARGALHYVPRCGGEVHDLTEVLPFMVAPHDRIAAGGGYVYLLTTSALVRVRTSDHTVTSLPINPGCGSGLVANPSHLFVYDHCFGNVSRFAHGEVLLLPFAAGVIAIAPQALALGPDHLYVQRGNEVWRRSLTSAFDDSSRVYDAGEPISHLAADAGNVFDVISPAVNGYARMTARRIDLNTRVPVTLGGDLPPPHGWALLSTPEGVYFHDLSPKKHVTVRRYAPGLSQPANVLRRSYTQLAAEGERLFWTEGGGVFTSLPQPAIAAGAEVSTAPEWSRVHLDRRDMIRAMAPLPDGRFVAIGMGGDPFAPEGVSGDGTSHLIAFTDTGTLSWHAPLPVDDGDPAFDREQWPFCVATSPSGRITALSYKYTQNDPIVTLHRFDSNGTPLPNALEPNPPTSGAQGGCAHDAGDGLYVSYDDRWLMRKDPTGHDLWRKQLTLPAIPSASYSSGHLHATATGVVAGLSATSTESSVVHVLADGTEDWLRRVQGAAIWSVDVAPNGKILAAGSVVDGMDVGTGVLPTPRPLETFVFLLWLNPEGSVSSLHYLDVSAAQLAVRLASDGNVFLLAGGADRPAYFAPPNAAGNYVSGITLAKLTPAGSLLFSRNLSPRVDELLAPNGGQTTNDPSTLGPPPFWMYSLVTTQGQAIVAGEAINGAGDLDTVMFGVAN